MTNLLDLILFFGYYIKLENKLPDVNNFSTSDNIKLEALTIINHHNITGLNKLLLQWNNSIISEINQSEKNKPIDDEFIYKIFSNVIENTKDNLVCNYTDIKNIFIETFLFIFNHLKTPKIKDNSTMFTLKNLKTVLNKEEGRHPDRPVEFYEEMFFFKCPYNVCLKGIINYHLFGYHFPQVNLNTIRIMQSQRFDEKKDKLFKNNEILRFLCVFIFNSFLEMFMFGNYQVFIFRNIQEFLNKNLIIEGKYKINRRFDSNCQNFSKMCV